MLQEAVITNARDDGLAEVLVERTWVVGGESDMKTLVRNTVGAENGQHVYIDIPTGGLFKGAAAVYIIPIILLFVGYAIAAVLGAGEGISILCGFSALVLSYLAVSIISKKLHKKNPTPYETVKILTEEEIAEIKKNNQLI
ncbi:MAG: SoxR reducing system RseC family protein [Bacillota bacterium]|nr:SoxR reducing system RseC family protein [Bacillota bacterium]